MKDNRAAVSESALSQSAPPKIRGRMFLVYRGLKLIAVYRSELLAQADYASQDNITLLGRPAAVGYRQIRDWTGPVNSDSVRSLARKIGVDEGTLRRKLRKKAGEWGYLPPAEAQAWMARAGVSESALCQPVLPTKGQRLYEARRDTGAAWTVLADSPRQAKETARLARDYARRRGLPWPVPIPGSGAREGSR